MTPKKELLVKIRFQVENAVVTCGSYLEHANTYKPGETLSYLQVVAQGLELLHQIDDELDCIS
jgi:hypothetical protein